MEQENDLFKLVCEQDLHVECVKEFRFSKTRRWRFDYALPDYKIAIEVEGGIWKYGRHNRATGFIKDIEKYNEATLMGWKILRTTPQNLNSLTFYEMIKKLITLCNKK